MLLTQSALLEVLLLGQIVLKELGETDLPSIQGVFEACEHYFILTTGGSATPAAAHALYIQLPKGRSYDDKHILGICHADTSELIGVIDSVLGYPEPGMVTLGLFLIVPEYRHRDIGRKAYALLEQWVKDRKASAIRISVHEAAEDDVNFWKQAGFRSTGQTSRDGTCGVEVLEKVFT